MLRLVSRLFFVVVFVSLIIFPPDVFAQSVLRDRTTSITWADEARQLTTSENEVILRPDFEGVFYNGKDNLPWFKERIRVNSKGSINVRIEDQRYELLKNSEALQGLEIPASLKTRAWIQVEAKQPWAIITLMPLRRNSNTGQLEKLVSFRIEYDIIPRRNSAANSQRRAADNSVLASGTWFKIAVTQDGLFKLDKSFLEELGLNTATLNPATIGLFGNGGGMVPENNGDFRYDDLQENAIRIIGEADGSFDDGDYILFYGQSPHRWKLDPIDNHFRHELHSYDTKTYYFLTTDRGTGKRVGMLPSEVDPATVTTSSFDDYAFVDDENVNLLQSGRNWYGDFFDALTNSREYIFNFPNRISSEPLWFRTNAAARSAVTSSSFIFSLNENPVAVMDLSTITIGFDRLYATSKTTENEAFPSGDEVRLGISYNSDASARGWLNYAETNVRRQLSTVSGSQLIFRDSRSVGLGFVTQFNLESSFPVEVWNVTDPTTVKSMEFNSTSPYGFRLNTTDLQEFVAFTTADVYPSSGVEIIAAVANQNLHNPAVDHPRYIVIAHPDFLDQARRLAAHHKDHDGMDTVVANVFQIYNEFSSGSQDVSAIRDYLKYFYDRASTDEELPRYVLLFGDGSYDYKNAEYDAGVNSNFIPTFQSRNSTDPISSFTSDDFYGFLDEGEGGSMIIEDTMGIDIGIGRIPVRTITQAASVVDKILHYVDGATYGSWRNSITFVADDEDNNTHIDDSDEIAQLVVAPNYPLYNVDKIYLDAYQQTSASGGERYPDAQEAINNRIFSGTLIINYTGHGSERTWAKENVLSENDINSWDNIDKLTLFVTATCSFSRYDNPGETSAGEQTLLNQKGGSVGLITTVRLVFSSANFQINREIYRNIFEPLPDGKMPALGDVVRSAKNSLAFASSDGENNRKFTLLGDPAMQLAYPEYNVVTTAVDGVTGGGDTLSALQKVTISGQVRGVDGLVLEDFNGVVSPTIYDKASLFSTLVNDPGKSNLKNFLLQKNIIYRGNASVTNGEFEFTFIVPKDISYTYGTGKISYYAQDGSTDAAGYDADIVIGGTNSNPADDSEGPEVKIYMNDESFAFGGITDENPTMLVKLEDESGINTVGNGIGHDITGLLDEAQNAINLNDFYEADLDSYQTGSVRYRLQDLEPGRHVIAVKAWDVYNNSGDGYTEFVVADGAELALDHVLNYPNPFTTRTEFMFEHNRPGDMLSVVIEIFTVSGKRIKTIVQDVLTDGFRADGIEWDGLDDYGDNIGRGVYVYKVSVRSLSNPDARDHRFEKLVLLR